MLFIASPKLTHTVELHNGSTVDIQVENYIFMTEIIGNYLYND